MCVGVWVCVCLFVGLFVCLCVVWVFLSTSRGSLVDPR